MSKLLASFVSAAILVVCIAADARQALVAHLVQKDFSEHLRTEATVSARGSDIVGILLETEANIVGADRPLLRIPKGWEGGHVCVEMASRDGLYVAANTFEIPASESGGLAQLQFDSGHREFYRAATPRSFAIAANVGDCERSTGDFLPVAWSLPPDGADELRLLFDVQSGRTDATLEINQSPTHCEPIHDARLTAFDTICTATLDHSRIGRVAAQVKRCAFGDCAKSALVSIRL